MRKDKKPDTPKQKYILILKKQNPTRPKRLRNTA